MDKAKTFLAGLLQISTEVLERALEATDGYAQYRKRKRSGGYRTLSVPPEPLRSVQRRILRRVLCLYHTSLHYSIHGFRRGHSIVSNAQGHAAYKKPYVLRLDLENAFDNVREEHFRTFFRIFLQDAALLPAWHQNNFARRMHVRRDHADGGWPEERPDCAMCGQFGWKKHALWNAFAIKDIGGSPHLSALVNRFMRAKSDERHWKEYRDWLRTAQNGQMSFFDEPEFVTLFGKAFELLLKLCFHRGVLPQGAPTSPYLLNLAIAFSQLPQRLEKLSSKIMVCADSGSFLRERERICRTRVHCEKLPLKWDELARVSQQFRGTFYADDITFSSSYSFNERPFSSDKRTVKEMIIACIEEDGRFKVNRKKTKMYNRHKEHPLVTGLRLSPKGIRLPKKKVRWYRSFFRHAQGNPEREAEVKGHIAFLKMVYGEKFPRQLGVEL